MSKYIPIKEAEDVVENRGDVLVSRYYHMISTDEGFEAIHVGSAVETVEDKPWEIFHVQHETKEGYYGMPAEGMGLINCYVLKSDARLFSERELENLKGKTLGLYGSHTGKFSGISYALDIIPIKNKY